MAEVGPEVRQPGLDIDVFPVPLDHPMHDEAVSQIMDPRTGATSERFRVFGAHVVKPHEET
jgi:hypothetical protein